MDSQDRIILHNISEIKPSTRNTAQHRAEGTFEFYLQKKIFEYFSLNLKGKLFALLGKRNLIFALLKGKT